MEENFVFCDQSGVGLCIIGLLIYAFEMLTGSRRSNVVYSPKADGIYQLLGFGMFLLWFIILAFYFYLIRKASIQIDLVEEKDGKEIVRRKKFDRILQGGFLLTGILIRWCYLIFFYLPGLK